MSPTDARRMTVAGLTLAAGEVLGKMATLVMLGVLARAVGVSDFGSFSYALGLGLLLVTLTTLGLDQRLVQLAGHEPATLSSRLSTLLALRFALGALVVAATGLVVLTTGYLGDGLVTLALVIAAWADGLSEAFRSAASSRHVQSGPAVVLVVQRFTALGLVVAALGLGAGLVGAALAYLVASLFGAVLMGLVAWVSAGLRPGPRLVSRAHLHDFVTAIRVNGLNDLVSMALFRIDVVIIAWLAGPVAVGHYTAAYRLVETVLFISWSIARVLLPALADQTPGSPDRSRTISGALALAGVVYLPYGAVLLVRGDEIVRLLFGDDFGSVTLIGLLALAPFFFGVAQVCLAGLLAVRPDPAVLAASGLALTVNVVLDVLLVPRWGAQAAAAATTLSYAVQAAVLLRAVRLTTSTAPARRSLALSAGAALMATLALMVPVPLLVALALGGSAFVSVWWLGARRWDPVTYALLRAALIPKGQP